jgi:Protein of unknown function (DUF2752)
MQTATAPVGIDVRGLRIAAVGVVIAGLAYRLGALPSVVLCPLRRVTGVPCPFCGATRSVGAAVQGDLGASLALNPVGFLIIVAAVVLLVAWRWRRVAIPVWSITAFFASLWAYQLFKYATGRPL